VTVSIEDENPRAGGERDPAFRDSVTFSFGDPVVSLYGLARLGLGGDGASGFAIVHHDEEIAGSSMETLPRADAVETWDEVRAAGVRSKTITPLEAWNVSYDGGPAAGFDLRFEAVSAPAALGEDNPAAQAAGMNGYEQLCAVKGVVLVGGQPVNVRCHGQRGHLWGAPDWSRIELARTLSAWFDTGNGVTLTAVRPAKAKHHDEELVAGFVITGGEPVEIFDPRLSTAYDAEDRQRRAGLELWMQEEGGTAHRAAGEAVCGTTMDLGDLQVTSAFFHWKMEGLSGAGRYDVLRRVPAEGSARGLRRRR
jgi:hypothetical protein